MSTNTTMADTKPWYQSQTIWASILQMVVGVAIATGLVNDAQASIVIAEGPGLIIGGVTLALGVWSAIGRARAVKAIV